MKDKCKGCGKHGVPLIKGNFYCENCYVKKCLSENKKINYPYTKVSALEEYNELASCKLQFKS